MSAAGRTAEHTADGSSGGATVGGPIVGGPIVGGLLAGGASRRMGRDKAGVVWRDGATLGQLAEDALRATCVRTVVLGHGAGLAPQSGRLRLEDAEPGGGPLPAIATLLATDLGAYYLITPCDMPGVNADVLGALVDAARGRDGAVLVDGKGRPQPLPICLSARVSEVVARLVAHGERRVGVLRRAVSLAQVTLKGDTRGVLRNVNRPTDVRTASLPAASLSAADLPVLAEMAQHVAVERLGAVAGAKVTTEAVAVEAPLQILLGPAPIAVLMRTPGHDNELVTGFLLSERIIASIDDLDDVAPCDDIELPAARGHVVRASLRAGVAVDLTRITRSTTMGSSCGICGQTSIEQALQVAGPVTRRPEIPADVLACLPQRLRAAQATFELTGGLHAAALFDARGVLHVVREDVGRHNATDKVLGYAARHALPADEFGLFVSGRVSFEIVQKAMASRIGVVAGVSAPTSLAVALAALGGVVLYGFVREGRATRYGAGAATAPPRNLVGDGGAGRST